MLTYRCTKTLEVVGFSDSDYAGCVDDKKSTYGYIFMMVEGAVSWKGVKQTLTASSTMEAKYVACYDATCHAIWFQNFISTLEVVQSISKSLKVFCDNSTTVSFSRNTRSTSRCKHIDVIELGLEVEALEEPLYVSSPLGIRVRIGMICRGFELEISGILLTIDLGSWTCQSSTSSWGWIG